MAIFSIIIPTCNRNEQLGLCLNQLKPGAQSFDATQYEVVVTDDGKNVDAELFLQQQYPWVRYTRGPQRGPAANRNRGAALATGKWLVFTDDDCLPDAHWLQAYNEAITANPDCLAFEGAILPDDWNLLKKDMAECPVNDKGGCFWSANIMVQKNLFWQVGGFDEQFKIAAQEDQDIFLRLQPYTAVAFIANSIIVHPVRKVSLRRKLSGIKSAYENWIYFYQKHHHHPIKNKLYSNIYDYLKISCKNLFALKFRSFVVSIYSTIYSGYLFLSIKE